MVLDLYKADASTLLKVATAPSFWRERWDEGDKTVPVPLSHWVKENYTDREESMKELIYFPAGKDQVSFVLNDFASLFHQDNDFFQRAAPEHACPVGVIATHRSKSVVLPVYRLERKDIGLRIYLRDNHYNWKMSVDSVGPVDGDFTGLFQTAPPPDPGYGGDELNSVYFEGFPERLVFPYYGSSDGRRWSACLYGKRSLWTVLFLIMRSLGVIGRMEANTKESHRRSLDLGTARRLLEERHPDIFEANKHLMK